MGHLLSKCFCLIILQVKNSLQASSMYGKLTEHNMQNEIWRKTSEFGEYQKLKVQEFLHLQHKVEWRILTVLKRKYQYPVKGKLK